MLNTSFYAAVVNIKMSSGSMLVSAWCDIQFRVMPFTMWLFWQNNISQRVLYKY